MTTLAQEQKYEKPASKAGFMLLLAILVVLTLITFRDIPSSTVATVKPVPESSTSLMRLKSMVQMPWQDANA